MCDDRVLMYGFVFRRTFFSLLSHSCRFICCVVLCVKRKKANRKKPCVATEENVFSCGFYLLCCFVYVCSFSRIFFSCITLHCTRTAAVAFAVAAAAAAAVRETYRAMK